MIKNEDTKLLKFQEAAHECSVSLRTIQRAVLAGQLPCVRLGRKTVRIKRADLLSWQTAHRQGGAVV
jgi:excisionase family DNA binding protein